jgi:hypothetical protein
VRAKGKKYFFRVDCSREIEGYLGGNGKARNTREKGAKQAKKRMAILQRAT